MRTISKHEFNVYLHDYLLDIEKGALFIYPTDTIYGIGCNAQDKEAVKKLRDVKGRTDTPFSIIPPSKKWILENCFVDDNAREWVEKLPGPYTLVLKLKNKDAIASEVNNGMETIGIRFPDHWFTDIVRKLEKPIITTSANMHGMNFMTNIEDLDSMIKSRVKFIIYEGEKKGSPSKIIRLDKEGEVVER